MKQNRLFLIHFHISIFYIVTENEKRHFLALRCHFINSVDDFLFGFISILFIYHPKKTIYFTFLCIKRALAS